MKKIRTILIGAALAAVCGCAGVPVKKAELDAMKERDLIGQLNRSERIADSYVGWKLADTTKEEYISDVLRRLYKFDADLRTALSEPLQFSVIKDKSEEPWARAKLFIKRFSPMKLQTDTDNALETYDPVNKMDFGYSVAKIAMGHDVRFVIRCTGPSQSEKAERNAHLLAYYMRMNKLYVKYVNR